MGFGGDPIGILLQCQLVIKTKPIGYKVQQIVTGAHADKVDSLTGPAAVFALARSVAKNVDSSSESLDRSPSESSSAVWMCVGMCVYVCVCLCGRGNVLIVCACARSIRGQHLRIVRSCHLLAQFFFPFREAARWKP